MHPISIVVLLVLIAAASSQCFGVGCGGGCFGVGCGGGCYENNCGPRVTVIRVPNSNNGCTCNGCYGSGCAPRCGYCPNPFEYSSCCNNNNFSCCGFGYRLRRSIANRAARVPETLNKFMLSAL